MTERRGLGDLCAFAGNPQNPLPCLGFFLDEGFLRGPHEVRLPGFTTPVATKTLKDIVEADRASENVPKLNDTNVRELAVVLASSLLQLHSTPWLSEDWDKSRIHFLQPERYSVRGVTLREPYISRSFGSEDCAAEGDTISSFAALMCRVFLQGFFFLPFGRKHTNVALPNT